MVKREIIDVDSEMFPEHPLFPLEEGEDAPDISFMHITRWEKGKQVYASKLFTAAELTTLEQIQQLYGGGEYILIARKGSKSTPGQPGQISRHRKVSITGAPRPMSDDPADEEIKKPAPAPPAQAGMFGGDSSSQIFIAMMQMNQQAQERAAQAQQQFMTMFIQMMQSSKTESAAMTQMMMQMSQAQAQSMMQMVSGLMANRGGGPEEMSKYAELLKTLGFAHGGAPPKDEEKSGFGLEDLPSMIENVADIATAAAELRRGGSPPTNGATAPQMVPGDNSAAGIAAAMGLGK